MIILLLRIIIIIISSRKLRNSKTQGSEYGSLEDPTRQRAERF